MRFVCNAVSLWFISLMLMSDTGHCQHEGHDHGHDHGTPDVPPQASPFSVVNTYLASWELAEALEDGISVEKITFDNTAKVVEILLEKFNCPEQLGSRTYTECDKCQLQITNLLFDKLGTDKYVGLSEEEFEKASVILLYLFSQELLSDVCKNLTAPVASVEDYAAAILNTNGSPNVLTEDELDTLLDMMNEKYTMYTISMCFHVESLFDEAVIDHEHGATEDEFFHLSSYILSYLLQGYCIGVASEIGPETFLDDIYNQYGYNGYLHEEDFEEILTALSIGGIKSAQDDGHGHDHGHEHKKRSVNELSYKVDSRNRRADEHDHDHDHDHDGHDHGSPSDDHGIKSDDHGVASDNHGSTSASEAVTVTCFSGEKLLDIYGIDHAIGIAEEEFVEMCPALIQQTLRGSCNVKEETSTTDAVTPLVWVYGTIAVLIISLGSLCGAIILPFLPVSVYEKLIHSLISMSVAILAGDALIHLLPLATGLHSHGVASEYVHSPFDPEMAFVWKTLVTLMAIYVFYLLETFMGWYAGDDHIHTHSTDINLMERHNSLTNKFSTNATISTSALTNNIDPDESIEIENGRKNILKKYGPLPIMIIIGDGLHNFGDGLAIGAAFTASVTVGLSTSIAVLCHEIPHELGDLAILLKSGLELKWALFLNFLSAVTAFAGLYLGLVLGTTEEARQWIFAITAGMFLYVSLADMMPQLTRIRNVKDPLITFILQNIAFLFGAIFIFIIAIYEDAIRV